MKLFLIIFIVNIILFSLLFIYCACKVASNADEIMEKMNKRK